MSFQSGFKTTVGVKNFDGNEKESKCMSLAWAFTFTYILLKDKS